MAHGNALMYRWCVISLISLFIFIVAVCLQVPVDTLSQNVHYSRTINDQFCSIEKLTTVSGSYETLVCTEVFRKYVKE